MSAMRMKEKEAGKSKKQIPAGPTPRRNTVGALPFEQAQKIPVLQTAWEWKFNRH